MHTCRKHVFDTVHIFNVNLIIISILQVQRTIGRQVTLKQRIGKGRYGEVYLGEWGGTFVAVKSFHSMEETSWLREKQIYMLALIKHPNILGKMKILNMEYDTFVTEHMKRYAVVQDLFFLQEEMTAFRFLLLLTLVEICMYIR